MLNELMPWNWSLAPLRDDPVTDQRDTEDSTELVDTHGERDIFLRCRKVTGRMIVEEANGRWPKPENTREKLLGIHSHATSPTASDNGDLADGATSIDRHETEPFAALRA
jgi:hypothetical protein